MIRRAAICFVLSWGVLSARAASDEPASGGGLQEAKDEFATIKDATVPVSGADARKALPRINGIDAPSVAPLLEAPSARKASAREEKKARRSQNWLVEAMMKEPSDQRDPRKRDAEEEESLEEAENMDPMERLLVEQLRGDDTKAAQAAEELRTREELKDAVVNPLNDFMAAWISSRDHELLLGEQAGTQPDTAFRDFRLPTPSLAGDGGLGAFKLTGAETTRVANPYLSLPDSGLREENPVVTVPGLGPPPTVVPLSGTAPLQPEPVIESKRGKEVLPPVLTKPEEDARYFPQLKRF
ncbi:MAG: hypothetical protein R3F03_05315 [Opitutaceae bacterium]